MVSLLIAIIWIVFYVTGYMDFLRLHYDWVTTLNSVFSVLIFIILIAQLLECMKMADVMFRISRFPKHEANMRKEIADLQEVIKKFEASA